MKHTPTDKRKPHRTDDTFHGSDFEQLYWRLPQNEKDIGDACSAAERAQRKGKRK
jgi:hypothetical protein